MSEVDPFVRERFAEIIEEREKENTPEPEVSRELRVYESIKNQIASLDNDTTKSRLEKLFLALQKSILNYTIAIDRLSKHKLNGKLDAIENADKRRSITHNVLIDDLNILSRQFDEAGLDNSWRADVGSDRRDITKWAIAITETVRQQTDTWEGCHGEKSTSRQD
jgi:hypothetical protein